MIEFDPDTLKDPKALRNAFGTYMTGVTVVTTLDSNGQPLGFTANSFTSVSLEPPLVSICLANTSRNYEAFATAAGFAVNVLAESQIEISSTFARPVDDRFSSVDWQQGPQGSPILNQVSAWFDCSTFKTVDAGDHLILIGEVKAYDHGIAPGLGYARGAYVTPAAEAEALSAPAGLIVSALIERDGKVLLLDDGNGQLSLPTSKETQDGAHRALALLIEQSGLRAVPGFVYSIYQDEACKHHHIAFLCQAADGEPTNGAMVELNELTLMDITDPAMCTMLERFANESRMDSLGMYCGNQVRGEVSPLVVKE